MEVYISHEPDGTSVKNMIRFAQIFFKPMTTVHQKKNQLHYNQTIPPIYNIRPMTIPTAIFWPRDDWLADPDDVA
ncbi:unnamed protein product, partial [Rotaria socialis]